MTTTKSIAEIINGMNAEGLRAVILASCQSDKTETTSNSIWAECLAIDAKKSNLPGPAEDIENTTANVTPRVTPHVTPNVVPRQHLTKMASLGQMLRELHKELSTLVYKVCTVHDIPIPSAALSSTDAEFLDETENPTDRQQDLRRFTSGTQGVLSRGKEVLGQVQECLLFAAPSQSSTPKKVSTSSATWSGVNDPRWNKFNKK
ncbi:hypothetical protein F4781DRAFT_391475 [Annulohypoxylon bovei var. microspora]|nr:hypothetical protein F4781DRAFT_391475 [Annulohypoxylon bovei var. microspora]